MLTVTSPKPDSETVPEEKVVLETTRCWIPGCADCVMPEIVIVCEPALVLPESVIPFDPTSARRPVTKPVLPSVLPGVEKPTESCAGPRIEIVEPLVVVESGATAEISETSGPSTLIVGAVGAERHRGDGGERRLRRGE